VKHSVVTRRINGDRSRSVDWHDRVVAPTQLRKEESMAVQGRSDALVVDLMAGDPIVVGPDLAVAEVAQILADYDVRGLPVVDADGRLVGVVSQTDLVSLWASSVESSSWPGLVVRDVMTKPALTIRGSASLRQAAQAMTNGHVHRLVVVGDDAETALGVISDSDLVRALPR
jgi:CBS domain-containing protein